MEKVHSLCVFGRPASSSQSLLRHTAFLRVAKHWGHSLSQHVASSQHHFCLQQTHCLLCWVAAQALFPAVFCLFLTPREKQFYSFGSSFSHPLASMALPHELVTVCWICRAPSTAHACLCSLALDFVLSFSSSFPNALRHLIYLNFSTALPLTFQFIGKADAGYEEAYQHSFSAVCEITPSFVSDIILLPYLKGQKEPYGMLRVYIISGKQSAGCN